MTGFFDIEPVLVERLMTRLPPEVRILTAANMDSVKTLPRGVRVLFWGYNVTGNGVLLGLEQTWLTILSIAHNKNAGRDSGMRDEAGPLIDTIIAALHRYQPTGYRPLRLANAFAPLYEGGMAHFPLAWHVNFKDTLCPT